MWRVLLHRIKPNVDDFEVMDVGQGLVRSRATGGGGGGGGGVLVEGM